MTPVDPIRVPRLAGKISLAAIGVLLLSFALQKRWTVDYGWQLQVGRWIVDHRALPVIDPFSVGGDARPYVEIRWLFTVALSVVHALGGPALATLLAAALVLAAFALLIRAAPGAAVTPPGLAVLGLAVVAASGRFMPRPESVTFVLLALHLLVLDRVARGMMPVRRALLVLVPAQALWNNVHVLFGLGPFLGATVLFGDSLERLQAGRRPRVSRDLALVLAAQIGALLLQGNGLRGLLFPFASARQVEKSAFLGTWIEEFRSPFSIPSWGGELIATALLSALVAASFALPRALRPARIGIALTFAVLAGLAVRNVALLAIAGAFVALRNLDEGLLARPGLASRLASRAAPVHAGLTAATLALAALVVTDRWAVWHGSEARFGLGVLRHQYPERAVDFLLSAAPKRELFHAMADGGYLIERAAGRYPVLVDGRTEVYGDAFFESFAVEPSRDLEAYLSRHDVNVLLLRNDHQADAAARAASAPGWALVHLDEVALVFVRRIPEHEALLARHALDPAALGPKPGDPDDAPYGPFAGLGAVERPLYSMGMARSLLLAGAIDAAARHLERAVVHPSRDPEARLLLAQIRKADGDEAAAAALMEGLHPSPEVAARARLLESQLLLRRGAGAGDRLAALSREAPADTVLLSTLARSHAAAGRWAEAREAWKAASAIQPLDPTHLAGIGLSSEALGDVAGARAAYEAALRLDPRQARVLNQLGVLAARTGNGAEASRLFRAALAVDPAYAGARRNLERLEAGAGRP